MHAIRLACLLAVAPMAAHAQTVCSDQPARMAAKAGVYAPAKLVERVRRERRWDLSQQGLPPGPTEVRVARDGSVAISWAWHEGVVLGGETKHGCLVFEGQRMQLQHTDVPQAAPMVRVAGPGGSADAPYFNLLFKGCQAEANGERWCFTTNRITTAGTRRKATLKLDLSELPEGGSVLEVEGDTLFWLFVPRGSGWAVYRTPWASAEGYQAPAWDQPWKVLAPVRSGPDRHSLD